MGGDGGRVARWLVAYTLSVISGGACALALGWAARDLAGPSRIGLVLAVGALPRAVLMPLGGALADRFGPRRVVLASDGTRCVLVAGLATVLALGHPGWWVLLVVSGAYGVLDALFLPAVAALPARLTDEEHATRMQGLRSLAVRLGDVLGAPAAGLAVAVTGTAGAFTGIAVLLAVSLLVLLTVRPRALPPDLGTAPGARGPVGDVVDGWRHVRERPVLVALLVSLALSELADNPPLAIGVVLLADQRGWGPAGTGVLLAAFGAGAGAGALSVTVRGGSAHAGRVYIGASVVSALALAGTVLAAGLPAAAGCAALLGLASGLAGALLFGLVQTLTDPAFLGRVMALVYLVAVGLAPLSYPAFDALAARWGVVGATLACAGVELLAAGVAAASPAVRGPAPARRPA